MCMAKQTDKLDVKDLACTIVRTTRVHTRTRSVRIFERHNPRGEDVYSRALDIVVGSRLGVYV